MGASSVSFESLNENVSTFCMAVESLTGIVSEEVMATGWVVRGAGLGLRVSTFFVKALSKLLIGVCWALAGHVTMKTFRISSALEKKIFKLILRSPFIVLRQM